MADKKILIKIIDETGASTEANSSQENLTTQTAQEHLAPSSSGGKENRRTSKGIALAGMAASRSFSYVTSNIGKWTGNSQNQQKVNNAMQLASLGITALINPYVAAVCTALSLATVANDEAYDRKWEKKNADQARARAGYSSLGELVGRRH